MVPLDRKWLVMLSMISLGWITLGFMVMTDSPDWAMLVGVGSGLVLMGVLLGMEFIKAPKPDVAELVAQGREILAKRRRDPVRAQLPLTADPAFIHGELNDLGNAAATPTALAALLQLVQEEAKGERHIALLERVDTRLRVIDEQYLNDIDRPHIKAWIGAVVCTDCQQVFNERPNRLSEAIQHFKDPGMECYIRGYDPLIW